MNTSNTIKAQMRESREKAEKAGKELQSNLQRIVEANAKPKRARQILESSNAIIQADSALSSCTPESIEKAIQKAIAVGLVPDGVNNQISFIARKGRLYADIGYQGFVTLLSRSRPDITIHVDVICENDTYKVKSGTTPSIEHEPALSNRGKAVLFYAVAFVPENTHPSLAYMTEEEMKEHRNKYAPKRTATSAWNTAGREMGKKTVLRRVIKILPIGMLDDLKEALSDDDDAETSVKPPGTTTNPDNNKIVQGEFLHDTSSVSSGGSNDRADTSSDDAPDDVDLDIL